MLMRPLNGANAELTGRVSRAAARGVMAAVSAGNYTLSRCILAGLVGERGLHPRRPGAPHPRRGPDSQRYPPPPSRPRNSHPPRLGPSGPRPRQAHGVTRCAPHSLGSAPTDTPVLTPPCSHPHPHPANTHSSPSTHEGADTHASSKSTHALSAPVLHACYRSSSPLGSLS